MVVKNILKMSVVCDDNVIREVLARVDQNL